MLRKEDFFETERQIFTVLRSAGFSPKAVLDIGASDGSWTALCMEIFPDAIYRLYEPLYTHLQDYTVGLRELASRNENITVRQVALADKVGVADFYVTPHSVGSSLLPLGAAKKIEMEVTTLDRDLVDIHRPFDILKMDTQGSELLILRGGKKIVPRASLILVESWLYRGYGPPTPLAHQIIEELSQYDFHLFNIGSPYFNERRVLYAVDLYFARADLLSLLGSIVE
jgi:FkbM family methyltransferase